MEKRCEACREGVAQRSGLCIICEDALRQMEVCSIAEVALRPFLAYIRQSMAPMYTRADRAAYAGVLQHCAQYLQSIGSCLGEVLSINDVIPALPDCPLCAGTGSISSDYGTRGEVDYTTSEICSCCYGQIPESEEIPF